MYIINFLLFVYLYFRNKLIRAFFDESKNFALSFMGDGYLHTNSLFSNTYMEGRPNLIIISIKPFTTEGLVMFAYDEQVCMNMYLCYL